MANPLSPSAFPCSASACACRNVLSSTSGSSRGLELLGALQDCLADPHPSVSALACEALHPLLANDDLDFYKTWPVVARALKPKQMLAAVGVQEQGFGTPATVTEGSGSSSSDQQQQQQQWYRPPGGDAAVLRHSAVGWCVARWVGLLQFGVMDAESQPEMVVGVVRLLWMATGASEAQVCRMYRCWVVCVAE